ncbi:MAG: hypothetical protein KY410_01080 [Proteobacteria bacterium]|nr:hypothetical protein [Pseudomonadota bacterium]
MTEARENKKESREQASRSRLVTLTVELGESGYGRIILDGAYMGSTGFHPGDSVEAIVQSGLISILGAD